MFFHLTIHSGVFSASSPALSVTSAILATTVIATKKYRLVSGYDEIVKLRANSE